MKTDRGVTLVELLVAVAVLGIVLVAASPGLADLINQRRTLAVADTLATDLMYARSEAGMRLQQVLVDFNADDHSSCYTLHYPYEGGDCDCRRGAGKACRTPTGRGLTDIELRTVSIQSDQGVSFSPVPGSWPAEATPQRVEFVAPLMSVYPPTGQINITGRRGLRLQLQLHASGRALLCARDEPAHGLPACP